MAKQSFAERRISGDFCKGGKGGGGQQPTGVDPTALGNAQLAANVGTAETQAQLNNYNTFSPYGSTTYQANQIDPNTGKPSSYNVTQQLSSDLQSLFGTQTGLAQQMAGGYAPFLGATNALLDFSRTPFAYAGNMAAGLPQGLDLSGVPNIGMLSPGSFQTNVTGGAGGQAIPNAVTNLPLQTNLGLQTSVNPQGVQALTQQAQDAAYKSQAQYLDPQFKQAEESMRQNLADQGIAEGSPEFSRAMGDFTRQKQAAYGNAGMQAVEAGNAQEQALYGQALAGGQFTNQALQAMGQFRNQALLQGGQFTNQAQQQLFGQGMSLADLYNQAVTAASGQNLQAQQANLGRAQAAFGAPWSAAQNFLGLGQGLYGTGLGTLGAALPGVTAWPSGATAIPNLAGGTNVSPANIVGAQYAATGAQNAAFAANQRNLGNTYLGANLGANMLFGNSLNNMFSGGGLVGGLSKVLGGGGGAGSGLLSWLGGLGSAGAAGATPAIGSIGGLSSLSAIPEEVMTGLGAGGGGTAAEAAMAALLL